ncbi:peptidase family M1-domain-containing protein [Paraphysoderma sedebokerense]|nr:peptidase family M1-domain-containing protein [Paraphysoderma sedebokerense]
MPSYSPDDPNSFANTHQARVSHVHLDLTTDFARKVLYGSVVLDFVALDKATIVILDTSGLKVQKAEMGGKELKFELSAHHEKFGSALSVTLPSAVEKGTQFKLKITYETGEKCTAAQWLAPEQTVGKKHPYLFTQCQAIHCRSLVPIQDSPVVKLTYSAAITVPSPLRALMSALRTGDAPSPVLKSHHVYKFNQPTSIPSYLIALAVGNLTGVDVGPRTTVFAEPEVVKEAASEFDETEEFIKIAENLITPYEWGRYDLLLLPASYPYGGMENSCLTFVTPTLLAGDKSLTDVIAHEISHSWAGNLVTTRNWEHFWLNEGWTMFIERKIIGRMKGEPHRQFSAIIGYKALEESIEHFGPSNRLTALKPDLKETDPDDAFSSVPYEKGFNFLYYLEQLLGGASVFEPYMKAYFQKFAHQSISTDDWKKYLYEYFESHHGIEKVKLLNTVEWDKWLNAPGLPPKKNVFDNTLASDAEKLAERWDRCRGKFDINEFEVSDLEKFSSLQIVAFLEKLDSKEPLPHQILQNMDNVYGLSNVRNSEIRFRWQLLCIRTFHAEYEPIYPHAAKFVVEQGRMKYVRPLYRALNKTKNGKQLALDTFHKNKMFYHPICGQMIAKDLGVVY